jgi:NAD(P)H-dependent FMN reductase
VSAIVKEADAFAFVIPEYNYGPPPSLINAFNYVYNEWNYKVAGFVSYGGVSGGLRSAQMAKQIAATLKLVTPPEGVAIPNFAERLDANREFQALDLHNLSAQTMLDEMVKWEGAVKVLRS